MEKGTVVARLPFHYGWCIVAGGTLCIFACLGIGRFALGMLLPSMAGALALDYSQMGVISTANFVGYLAAVLVCGRMMRRFGARRLIAVALLIIGCSMLLIGRVNSFWAVALLYTATGVGSGFANVPMMSLVVPWFSPSLRGRAAGFVVIGSGFAILLSGRLIPWLNSQYPMIGWRLGWFVLGGVVLIISLICWLVLRNDPADLGISPATVATAKEVPQNGAADEGNGATARDIAHLGAIYFCFGFSYVIYATFIVTAMVRDKGIDEAAAGGLWSWVGVISLLSGPVFGTFSDRFGRKLALTVVFFFQMAAYGLAAFFSGFASLWISIICFGFVAWSIPSIMAALVGDYVGRLRAAAVFGFVTFVFGIGQIIGPAIAGRLAEAAGNFTASFLIAMAAAGVGVVLSLALPAAGKLAGSSR